jgi:hypothetical protein
VTETYFEIHCSKNGETEWQSSIEGLVYSLISIFPLPATPQQNCVDCMVRL